MCVHILQTALMERHSWAVSTTLSYLPMQLDSLSGVCMYVCLHVYSVIMCRCVLEMRCERNDLFYVSCVGTE